MTQTIPLAERIRPKALSDIIGQSHLLGENAPIAKMVAEGYLPSMILHGNAGIGKTTLASLLAKSVGREFRPLSAINSGVKELREILTPSDGLFATPPVVFVDEIHRFNKAQQDALLGAVESGQITLIGATTENPSFSVNNALLSRCQVYKLEPLSDNEIFQIIKRAITIDEQLKKLPIVLNDISPIYGLAQGDARRALNLLELAIYAYQGEPIIIDFDSISKVAGQTLVRYDKDGDMHYDIISAFIKSVRGSDPDASIYWLARMLVAGEDPAFIARRLVILASEDIGLANPNALLLADTALRSVKEIGMPEARIILGQVAIYLATSPKSNESYKAINKALEFAKTDNSPVPLHLRNGVTTLMKSQGYGVDYIYPHDYPNHYYPQNYLPDNLIGMQFYYFGDNQKEQSSFNFIKWLKSQS
ncbi:replication-associated recombination protein A [Moraxella bovis]|uniref:replication-associated recombination protein A n=1 Tax=Moraxella bovis TaxID=476 RepID=UPI0022272715|nr:replication-associated recombination protein A [Moraxella bovis]UYZ68839.1 replication-associated recombination protein A [Moraxella bovis]UYZ71215.1 replication-associated recombination protein A [Moraxella bovis]UYZ72870.1 replication-associated recombination protein A [Moraxella bovis]UZA14509.1 replication-associated recombination protein A [Moraxella bovis]UZA27129.1 replication-associated recombination protein A [Moraxella bovis]